MDGDESARTVAKGSDESHQTSLDPVILMSVDAKAATNTIRPMHNPKNKRLEERPIGT